MLIRILMVLLITLFFISCSSQNSPFVNKSNSAIYNIMEIENDTFGIQKKLRTEFYNKGKLGSDKYATHYLRVKLFSIDSYTKTYMGHNDDMIYKTCKIVTSNLRAGVTISDDTSTHYKEYIVSSSSNQIRFSNCGMSII
jgi:hypothetical protein